MGAHRAPEPEAPLRTQVVEAYRLTPRGREAAPSMDPGRLRPRWLTCVVALGVVLCLAMAGTLTRVPIELSAAVTGADGSTVTAVLGEAPALTPGQEVGLTLRGGPADRAELSGTVRTVEEVGEVTRVVIGLDPSSATSRVPAGVAIAIRLPVSRPLLREVLGW